MPDIPIKRVHSSSSVSTTSGSSIKTIDHPRSTSPLKQVTNSSGTTEMSKAEMTQRLQEYYLRQQHLEGIIESQKVQLMMMTQKLDEQAQIIHQAGQFKDFILKYKDLLPNSSRLL